MRVQRCPSAQSDGDRRGIDPRPDRDSNPHPEAGWNVDTDEHPETGHDHPATRHDHPGCAPSRRHDP